MTKNINTIVTKCNYFFEITKKLLPEYKQRFKQYFDVTTKKATKAILKYETLLQQLGFKIDFFLWDDAKRNGIQFVNELPIRSSIDTICNC